VREAHNLGKSKFAFKGIDVELGELSIESKSAAFKEHGHAAIVKDWLQAKLADEIHHIGSEISLGRQDLIDKLPVMSVAPMLGLYFASFGADKMEFTEDFIEYEFSPVSMKLVKPSNFYDEFIQEINTEFAP